MADIFDTIEKVAGAVGAAEKLITGKPIIPEELTAEEPAKVSDLTNYIEKAIESIVQVPEKPLDHPHVSTLTSPGPTPHVVTHPENHPKIQYPVKPQTLGIDHPVNPVTAQHIPGVVHVLPVEKLLGLHKPHAAITIDSPITKTL